MAFSLASIRKAQRRRRAATPALPPLGSFDPQIMLQMGQNRRTSENAQQQFDLGQAQAQDDYAISLGRLGQNEQQNLGDILTQRQQLNEDRGVAATGINRNYEALAHRQSEGALRGNVQSAGLLRQSLNARRESRDLDSQDLERRFSRALAASTTAEQRTKQEAGDRRADLLLSLTRAFGSGTGGTPLGSNTLNLLQTKNDALGGNLDLTGVAFQQAAANGYTLPRRKRRTVIV